MVGTLLAKVSLRTLPSERYRGFDLYSLVGWTERDVLVSKLDEAFDLIAYFDPLTLWRIERSLQRPFLVPGGGDHYSPPHEAHMIDVPRLKAQSNTQTALNIVHEATHARLHRCGIRTTRTNIARIERLCVSQEVAFAARLPGGEQLIPQLWAMLEQEWWAEEQARSQVIGRLESWGWPRWLIRLATLPERLR